MATTPIAPLTALLLSLSLSLPLSPSLQVSPPNKLVKMSLEGRLRDGDLFVRDNLLSQNEDVEKTMLVWRVHQKCCVKTPEGYVPSLHCVTALRHCIQPEPMLAGWCLCRIASPTVLTYCAHQAISCWPAVPLKSYNADPLCLSSHTVLTSCTYQTIQC